MVKKEKFDMEFGPGGEQFASSTADLLPHFFASDCQ